MPTAVSFRYARALVDVVTEPTWTQGDPGALTAQLKEFATVLDENAELRILFETPAIAAAKKVAVLGEIAPKLGLQQVAQNFLGVLLEHERMGSLDEIVEAFEQLLNERLGIVVAEVSSAAQLSDTERKDLEMALHARTGKQVRMNFSLDPTLIGGATAKVGSTIYDGSVKGRLERLRAELASQASGKA